LLGLRVACGYQEVVKAYNEAVKLIHPDKCGMPGTDVAFMKLQPAYTDWSTVRTRQGWSHPATPSSAPVNSDSPGPAAAPGSAPQPQSHGPAQGTSPTSDNNIFSHCIIAGVDNSFHNWDVGLQFLTDKEISGKLFELRELLEVFCSVVRQPQFDVLAGKTSRPYDNGRVQVGDELPRPRTLDKF